MDIELARTFLAIVAAGSFVRAAERLNVSQTTVSARVRTLEEQLRRPLFIRNKTGASLTPAGEHFLRHAPALVQLWERARHEVAVPQGRRAVLAVGAELRLWDPLLLRWLLWMGRAAPDVALRAQVGLPEDLMDRVAEGILDLAVLYAPRYRAGLKVELLVEERLVMVTTPPGPGGEMPGYVHVDWGVEFAPELGQAVPGEPALHIGLGPLALSYILEAGGAGYFRMGAVRTHLESGRLALVPGAPEFLYPAYAVHAEAGDAGLIRTALEGLRGVVATDQDRPRRHQAAR
ncbi:LysR family transcriptional regulator [Siccirubricoccus sp. KC 17139]|uniref:LysR family transcriptional regulator n=1 Tax=Siccirubricoccus soli TaxID=2899147 RepID=A0ABT1DE16_9PROT|nr:LysR family transcriptional regulator [Siccirubricoccus soli]MCO6419500.1 LysR family transcriptional regulator [Siccirubricoccus soli]MCP2685635.1 LysR family transcriptional regulator [Siccirubricoccus soli]